MTPLIEQAFFIYRDTLIYCNKSTKYAALDPDGQIITSSESMYPSGVWTSYNDVRRLFFIEYDKDLLDNGNWKNTQERIYPIDTLEAIVFAQSKQSNKPNE